MARKLRRIRISLEKFFAAFDSNRTCAQITCSGARKGYLRDIKGEYTPISEVDAEMMNHRKVK